MKNKRALAITVTLLTVLISLSCAAAVEKKPLVKKPKYPMQALRITRAVPVEARIKILENSIKRWEGQIKNGEGRVKGLKKRIKNTEKEIRQLKRQKKAK